MLLAKREPSFLKMSPPVSASNQSVSLSRVLVEISSLVFHTFWLMPKTDATELSKIQVSQSLATFDLKIWFLSIFKKFIIFLVLNRAE